VGTSVFPAADAPFYARGMLTCAAFMLLVALLALVLRWHLARENARNGASASPSGRYVGVGHRARKRAFTYIL
jgi:hypothetical protein